MIPPKPVITLTPDSIDQKHLGSTVRLWGNVYGRKGRLAFSADGPMWCGSVIRKVVNSVVIKAPGAVYALPAGPVGGPLNIPPEMWDRVGVFEAVGTLRASEFAEHDYLLDDVKQLCRMDITRQPIDLARACRDLSQEDLDWINSLFPEEPERTEELIAKARAARRCW